MNSLLKRIRDRGYWLIEIRPTAFRQDRVANISALLPLLRQTQIRRRGWEYPYIDEVSGVLTAEDYIAQSLNWEHRKTVWRMYQSGLFVDVFAMPIDWRDESTLWPADDSWKQGAVLGVGDVVHTFTEIYEFAARLAASDIGEENMRLNVTVANIKNRQLYVDSQTRIEFHTSYSASIPEFRQDRPITRTDLFANANELALHAALELFRRFGWDPSIPLLRDWQAREVH